MTLRPAGTVLPILPLALLLSLAACGGDELPTANQTGPVKIVVQRTDAGSGPTMSMPGMPRSSLRCWKPSATSPRAMSVATGVPGGACTSRDAIAGAMPQRSKSCARCAPLGPLE